jgi:ABC-type antimicrobial peptide transport system permease subunit
MALRVSIGAGRGRLIQLMLVESALLALVACGVGALFASWAAPFIVSMLAPAERPVRLALDVDWRTLVVRTVDDAPDLRPLLSRQISRMRPDFQLRDVAPFDMCVTQQMIRERLLAALSAFFGVLVLLRTACCHAGPLRAR